MRYCTLWTQVHTQSAFVVINIWSTPFDYPVTEGKMAAVVLATHKNV